MYIYPHTHSELETHVYTLAHERGHILGSQAQIKLSKEFIQYYALEVLEFR